MFGIVNKLEWNMNRHVLVEMIFGLDTFIFPRCKGPGNECHGPSNMDYLLIKDLLSAPEGTYYTKDVIALFF